MLPNRLFKDMPNYESWRYRKYLPTAFDDSYTMYEQIATLIEYFNNLNIHINKVVEWMENEVGTQNEKIDKLQEEWGKFEDYIVNILLKEKVVEVLKGWLDDGTLAKIINEDVMNMKPDKKHVRTSSRVLNLSEFDINVDGTDQSEKLQKILDGLKGGETLIFPTGESESDRLVIGKCLTLKANNVKFIKQSGAGYYETRIKGQFEGKPECNEPTIFNIDAYGFRCEGLVFEGDATGDFGEKATVTAIQLVRTDGSANVDAKIVDTRFSRLARGIYTKGKNVEVFRCDFDTSIKGVVIEQDTGQETRGHVINSCRFHSMGADSTDESVKDSVCVSIWGQVAFTYKNQIINNYADGIRNFFNGTLTESQINNNTIPWLRGKFIETTQAVSNAQIIANQVQDRYNGTGFSQSEGILLTNTTGSTIVGNQFTGLWGRAIALTNCSRNNLSGNTCIDGNWKNRDGVIGFHLDEKSIYNSIQNNTIDIVTNEKTGYEVAIQLDGNENQLGYNFIRGQKKTVVDNKASNRGEFGQYNHRRRIIYADTLATGEALIPTPNTGDKIIVAIANEGYPSEYRYQSGKWLMCQQAGVRRSTSVNRPPNLTTKEVGLLYLDTTLKPTGKPIWWNGDRWGDANGDLIE